MKRIIIFSVLHSFLVFNLFAQTVEYISQNTDVKSFTVDNRDNIWLSEIEMTKGNGAVQKILQPFYNSRSNKHDTLIFDHIRHVDEIKIESLKTGETIFLLNNRNSDGKIKDSRLFFYKDSLCEVELSKDKPAAIDLIFQNSNGDIWVLDSKGDRLFLRSQEQWTSYSAKQLNLNLNSVFFVYGSYEEPLCIIDKSLYKLSGNNKFELLGSFDNLPIMHSLCVVGDTYYIGTKKTFYSYSNRHGFKELDFFKNTDWLSYRIYTKKDKFLLVKNSNILEVFDINGNSIDNTGNRGRPPYERPPYEYSRCENGELIFRFNTQSIVFYNNEEGIWFNSLTNPILKKEKLIQVCVTRNSRFLKPFDGEKIFELKSNNDIITYDVKKIGYGKSSQLVRVNEQVYYYFRNSNKPCYRLSEGKIEVADDIKYIHAYNDTYNGLKRILNRTRFDYAILIKYENDETILYTYDNEINLSTYLNDSDIPAVIKDIEISYPYSYFHTDKGLLRVKFKN